MRWKNSNLAMELSYVTGDHGNPAFSIADASTSVMKVPGTETRLVYALPSTPLLSLRPSVWRPYSPSSLALSVVGSRLFGMELALRRQRCWSRAPCKLGGNQRLASPSRRPTPRPIRTLLRTQVVRAVPDAIRF